MNPLDDIATIRRVALYLGLVALALAAAMSFAFGWAMSWKHAALLALLTFAGSIVWPYIGHLKSSGFSTKAYAFSAAGVLFLAVELFSHVGYTSGQRMADVDQTGVQNANFQLVRDSVGDEKELIASMKKRLAAMQEQNAWAASVTASALRAELPALDLAIEQETARGGCKTKCLKLTKDKAAIEAKIATTETMENLTSQIEATQRVLDKKAETAVSTELKTSPVAYQTAFVSQIWTMSLDPGKAEKQGTQIGISFMLALVTTFLAPVLISIAYGPIEFVPGASKVIAKATEKATDAHAAMLRRMQDLEARLAPAPSHPSLEVHVNEADPDGKAAIRALMDLAKDARRLQKAA